MRRTKLIGLITSYVLVACSGCSFFEEEPRPVSFEDAKIYYQKFIEKNEVMDLMYSDSLLTMHFDNKALLGSIEKDFPEISQSDSLALINSFENCDYISSDVRNWRVVSQRVIDSLYEDQNYKETHSNEFIGCTDYWNRFARLSRPYRYKNKVYIYMVGCMASTYFYSVESFEVEE